MYRSFMRFRFNRSFLIYPIGGICRSARARSSVFP